MRERPGETEKTKKPSRFLQHRVGPLGCRGSPFARGGLPGLSGTVGVVERDADAALFVLLRVES